MIGYRMPMVRLIGLMTLVISILTISVSILAAAVGARLPTGEQVVFTKPRDNFWMQVERTMPPLGLVLRRVFDVNPDQWSTVSLVSLERSLGVNRYLPIQVSNMSWLADGDHLVVDGMRNQRLRTYVLGFAASRVAQHWLITSETSQVYVPWLHSPDMRYIAVLLPSANRIDPPQLTLKQLDWQQHYDYTDLIRASTQPQQDRAFSGGGTWMLGLVLWTRDSQRVIYSKIRLESHQQQGSIFNDLQANYYYFMNIADQREIPISTLPISNFKLSPDETKAFYSVPSKPVFPALSLSAYRDQNEYYVFDFATQQSVQLGISDMPSQVWWSPDSTQLAYNAIRAEESTSERAPARTLAHDFLTAPVEIEHDLNRGRFYDPYLGWVFTYNSPSGTITHYVQTHNPAITSTSVVSTYVVDLASPSQPYRIVDDEFGSIYTVRWQPDSSGLVFYVQRETLAGRLQQLISLFAPILSYRGIRLTKTFTEVYLADLRDSTGHRQPRRAALPTDTLLALGSSMPMNDVNSLVLLTPLIPDPQNVHVYMPDLTDPDGQPTEIWLPNEQLVYDINPQKGKATLLVTMPLAPSTPSPIPSPPAPTVIPFLPLPIPSVSGGSLVLSYQASFPAYRLYLLRAGDTEPRFLTDTIEPNSTYWSPKGGSLLYTVMHPQNPSQRVLYYVTELDASDPIIRPSVQIHTSSFISSQPFLLWRPR